MANPSSAHVDPVHADSVVGPTVGGRLATTSSNQYFDLSSLIGHYVRVRIQSESAFLCMCATSGATPETSVTVDTLATTDNVAELYTEGEVDQFVVTKDKPYLVFKRGGSTNGVLFVRPA
jgi:hypothetical protein